MGFVTIPGYQNYEINHVTNQVRSLNYALRGEVRVLKNCRTNENHLQVGLSRGGKIKTYRLHQLVMLIKAGPTPPGMQICHNDGDMMNNHPDNLRFGTPKENMNDRKLHGRYGKKVMQIDMNGNTLATFNTMRDAEKSIGKRTQVSECCRGKRKTSQGFIWRYLIE